MSQITTHILDTSIGKPAKNIQIILEKFSTGNWIEIGRGNTNEDGRLPNLLDPSISLELGNYRLIFDTDSYYKQQNTVGLYPEVTIVFTISENKHYHIPLLLNPFGYCTYRGS
jgi:5-hydroxyisourate hydrolase